MKKLLSLVGRALYFMTAKWEGEHFILHKTQDVPRMLDSARNLGKKGVVKYLIRDIEGCYPNMPKLAIVKAMQWMIDDATKQGHAGIWVPTRSTRLPCQWKESRKGGYKYMYVPFEIIMEVMKFSLDNAIVKMPDGQLWKQKKGIPMGDPISPAMTICACAAMERRWMASLKGSTKEHFIAGRYMDDILFIYAENDKWKAKEVIADFEESTCYEEPLRLEDGGTNTFLESTFEIPQSGHIRYWLKNANEDSDKVWRYQHFYSYAALQQKRALLQACLQKVQKMASDSEAIYTSGWAKLEEFRKLKYPIWIRKSACSVMARIHREKTWLILRGNL